MPVDRLSPLARHLQRSGNGDCYICGENRQAQASRGTKNLREEMIMRISGVILFSLALGAFLARPAPVAADSFTWGSICTNPLSTCAAVDVSIDTNNSIVLWVQNLSPTPLTSIGLSGSYLAGLSQVTLTGFVTPFGWTGSLTPGGSLQLWSLGGGWSSGPAAQFTFTFSGALPGNGIMVESLNGYSASEQSVGGGITPGGDFGPTTHAPEPTSLLLLGTGLAGVAVVRRRRRYGAEEEGS